MDIVGSIRVEQTTMESIYQNSHLSPSSITLILCDSYLILYAYFLMIYYQLIRSNNQSLACNSKTRRNDILVMIVPSPKCPINTYFYHKLLLIPISSKMHSIPFLLMYLLAPTFKKSNIFYPYFMLTITCESSINFAFVVQ